MENFCQKCKLSKTKGTVVTYYGIFPTVLCPEHFSEAISEFCNNEKLRRSYQISAGIISDQEIKQRE